MMVERRRVLVVGGAGFLGRNVLARLLASNYDVVALDLFKPDNLSGHIDWIIGSALDEALLASAVSDCEIVIFLASNSLPASANADLAAEISSHVRMVVKAAEIACDQGVKKFIFASSGGTVYGRSSLEPLDEECLTVPITAYGASKVAVENYLSVLTHTRGMGTFSLRISNPYGPGQRAHRSQGFIAAAMASAITGKTLPCWGDGSIVRDFVFVEDVAEAFVLSCNLDGPSRKINIGSGQGISIRVAIEAIERLIGRRLNIDYQPARSVDVMSNVLHVGLAADILQWHPKTSFVEGLERTAEWWAVGKREQKP